MPVDWTTAPIMMWMAKEDGVWPAATMAEMIADYREETGTYPDDLLLPYPNAGHNIFGPYRPMTGAHDMVVGDSTGGGAIATDEAWKSLGEFWRRRLSSSVFASHDDRDIGISAG